MNRKRIVIYLIVCVSLFVLGFVGMRLIIPTIASSSEDDYRDVGPDEAIRDSGLFSKDYYRYTNSTENKDIYKIERIKSVDEIPEEQLYTSKDIELIMKTLLGVSGEIREDRPDKLLSVYEEYENDLPTGKSMSVIYDADPGYIQFVILRNGKNNGAKDSKQFVDKKEAYDRGIAAIKKKYPDKNLDIKDQYDENAISVYYNPHKQCLCYTFDVDGAVDGKWGDSTSVFVFSPIINVNDLADIEVASSLCY